MVEEGVSIKVDLFVFVPVFKKNLRDHNKLCYTLGIVFHFERHIFVQVKLFPNYYIAYFVHCNFFNYGYKNKNVHVF